MFYEVQHLNQPIAVLEASSFADLTNKLLLLVRPEHRGEATIIPEGDGGVVAIGDNPGSYNENRLYVCLVKDEVREWVAFSLYEAYVPPLNT